MCYIERQKMDEKHIKFQKRKKKKTNFSKLVKTNTGDNNLCN